MSVILKKEPMSIGDNTVNISSIIKYIIKKIKEYKMGRYDYVKEELHMNNKSKRKIGNIDSLLNTINIEDIKTFRDIRTNTLYTISESIDPGDVSIVANNGDEIIVNEKDLMNTSRSPIAEAMSIGTFYRTYEN